MQKMLASGDSYFGMEAMREREPLMYQQMVGRFEKPTEGEEGDVPGTDCTLSNIILNHIDLDRRRDLERAQRAEEEEEVEFDEDEDEGEEGQEEDSKPSQEESPPDEATLEQYREDFAKSVRESFLDGRDKDFDYSAVDCDSDNDDLETLDRDQEERYFDGEDDQELVGGD